MSHQPKPFDALTDELFSAIDEPKESKLPRPIKLCPICQSQTKWSGVHLICDSPDCIGQLIKRLDYFYSKTGFDLHSIAEAMLAKLVLDPITFKIMAKNPWALLDPDSFNLTNYLYDIWKPKRTAIYLDNLAKINGKKNVAHFIAAMGYPGLAYRTVLKIIYFIKEGTVTGSITKKAQANFIEAYLEFQRVELLIPGFKFSPIPESPNVIYCITGTLATPRVDLIDYLSTIRWQWSNQVSRYIDYLVIGDDPGKVKITKAIELRTPTLTEDEFMEMIKLNKKEERKV
ncbi:MAG: hypothetical protein GY845_03155 [Planctomycetes bacterium]|nr:hypothetical protein [Planctomycetota bacterium]